MARILISSGPTRQYIDPVRYLTNASSGRMGRALADIALARGHQVVIVTGPVEVDYPRAAEVIPVISTEEMLDVCQSVFADCHGMIGVAAPCDYRPETVHQQKLSKTGDPLLLRLVETPDIVATLGSQKRADQWVVGFALETEDHRFRAIGKMQRKCCDLMVLNSPQAMNAAETEVEILSPTAGVVQSFAGSKEDAAGAILDEIEKRLIKAKAG